MLIYSKAESLLEGDQADPDIIDPQSRIGLLMAAGWLKECTEGHLNCTISDPEFMPNRLIDVGQAVSEPFLVDSKLKPAPYVALSYCWGAVQDTIKTTKENIADHRRCILRSSLPRVCSFFAMGVFAI